MNEARHPARGSVEAGALALQRVLALEGRDVLSRVELAASELARFALAPALSEQIGAIRDAVGELDTLLDKIERLANPVRPEQALGSARVESVFAAIRARIAPALAARGVLLEATGCWPTREVALPAAVLERLVLLWLRTALLALACDDAVGEEPSIVLAFEGRDRDDGVELRLGSRAGRRRARFEVERAAQVELDVALAEWRGLAVRGTEGDWEGLGLRLPACGRTHDV